MKQIAIANPFTGITVPGSTVDNASLGSIIGKLLPYIFSLAGLLLLIYMISGGLQLMLSRGDPKGIDAAKGRITNAILGFIIVILTYAIVKIVGQIFGITVFSQIFL